MRFEMVVIAATAACASFGGSLAHFEKGKETCFLLQSEMGSVHDASGHYLPKDIKVMNAEYVEDDEFGEVIRFGDRPGSIVLPDKGKVSFRDGMTFEAWIWLEEPLSVRLYGVLSKPNAVQGRNSFELVLRNKNRFTIHYINTPGAPIDYATFEGMNPNFKSSRPPEVWPSCGANLNGLCEIPTGRWTHIAFTYDRSARLIRTFVNGGVDRQAYLSTAYLADEIFDDDNAPVRLFDGATKLRVAQVHFASAPVVKCRQPAPFEVMPIAVPYREKQYVRIIPTDRSIELPVEVTIQNLKSALKPQTVIVTLDSYEPRNIDVPMIEWKSTLSDLVVSFRKNGMEFYRYESSLYNLHVPNPVTQRCLRGLQPDPKTKHKLDWWIENDNTITYKGKPIFPIMTCFVRTNDFELVTDLGFNQVLMKWPTDLYGPALEALKDRYFARAEEKGVTIQGGKGDDGKPAVGFSRIYDEPWGYSFDAYRRGYQDARNIRERPSTLPIYVAQNNWQRYRDTGSCCDILAVDPYWRGGSPMRNIYYSVVTAIRETDGLKPVSVSIGNWGRRQVRPDFDELRTMSYIGIIGGARSINYYSWYEGKDEDTGEMPDVIESYRRLFAEFKAIDEALTVPNANDGPTFVEENPGFFACLKQPRSIAGKIAPKNEAYVLVASDLYRPTERTMCLKVLAGKKMKLLYDCGRGGCSPSLAFDAKGEAKISMPPLSSAVYVPER